MDACAGLLGIDSVHTVFGFVALFVDGQDAEGGDGLKGIVCR